VDPETLTRRLAGRRVLLCLDYDGTLVPIAARPDLATFDDAGRRLLRALARHMPIAIVSGRSHTAVRGLVGVPPLIYVGNHGLEISGPHIRHRPEVPVTWRRDLNHVLRLIEADAPPGGMVERKGVTASIHYRLVAATNRRRWLPRLRARLAAGAATGRFRVVRGKSVLELRPPVDWNKGEAVRWLLARPALRNRMPVYLGDDTTDEDAFRVVRMNGVGVLVGASRRSAARYRLTGPADVRRLLVRWLQLLEGRPTISHSL
jgi:alpha,alpha-trehalase